MGLIINENYWSNYRYDSFLGIWFRIDSSSQSTPKTVVFPAGIAGFVLGEIQYGKAPLQEACLQIGERLPDPFREVLHSISEEISKKNYQSFEWVWREQFQLREKEFYFTEQEMEVLLGIGKNLGYLDVDAQIRHLQLYQREVDELLERMQRTAKEKKKVYRSVSLMIGAMVILLFV